MTPPVQRRAAARARSKCGRSAWPGDKALRLQWRAAPTRTAHAALARKRCPERSRMMMSGPPLPTLPLGRSAKRALHRASRAARSARRLRRPHHQEATRAVIGGGTTCRRPGAQRPRVRRRARSARRRKGCRRRPGAQRPRHRRRARSASRRWQPAAAPPGTQARSALGAQRRAPSAERVARGGGQARRRRRVRSAHATGAERVARGGASSGMLAQPAHAATLGRGRLLPAAQLLQVTYSISKIVWCELRLCHQHLAAGPLFLTS